LSEPAAGTSSFEAATATAPKPSFLPLGLCTSWPFCASTSPTGTFHWLAAACSSICRAAAPQRRIGMNQCRVLREPSVSWLPYLASSPGRLDDADALHVGFELVGDDARQAGADALAHLRAVDDDRDRAVGRDLDEDLRALAQAVRHAVAAVLLRLLRRDVEAGHADAEHQADSGVFRKARRRGPEAAGDGSGVMKCELMSIMLLPSCRRRP
jgi:hypothetical protein